MGRRRFAVWFGAMLWTGALAMVACDEGSPSSSAGSDGGLEDGGADHEPTGDASDRADGAEDAGAEDGAAADHLANVAPTFTPAGGTYGGPQCLVIASLLPNATIHYTTDGTLPTTSSPTYTQPLLVSRSSIIRAIATAPGAGTTPERNAVFTIDLLSASPMPPDIAPAAGEYANAISLSVSTPTDPSILCYTLDGSSPECGTAEACKEPGAVPATCTGTTLTYDAGSPILLDAPPGGGSVAIRARTCVTMLSPSELVTRTYTFAVAPIAIDGPGNQVAGYVPASNTEGSVFWSGGADADLKLQTATAGATIRYSRASGNDLPAPADVDCTQACAGDATCSECTPGGSGCQTGPLPALTTLKAIGCKAGYAASPLRQLVFADPSQRPILAAPSPDPMRAHAGPQPITLTVTPPDATVCYTLGKDNAIDPTCDAATGACTTMGPLPAGIASGTYDAANEPVASVDGAQVRAVACKAGLPSASNVVRATYRIQ